MVMPHFSSRHGEIGNLDMERFTNFDPDGFDGDQYLPNDDDELEVLAGCEKHYVWQSRLEMQAGVLAECETCLTRSLKTCKVCQWIGEPSRFVGRTCKRCKNELRPSQAKTETATERWEAIKRQVNS